MDAPTQTRRFHLTPGRFVLALLVVEMLLWLSDRFGWVGWHKGYAVVTAVAAVSVGLLVMLAWFGVAVVFRRTFQFSLRTLLVLAVVVALPCSWMAAEIRAARTQKKAVEAVAKSEGNIGYNYDYEHMDELREPWDRVWLRERLGRDFLDVPVAAGFRSDEAMEHLSDLNGLTWVALIGMDVTDARLQRLERLPQLRRLDLVNTEISGTGLEHLKRLSDLRCLYFVHTHVTDAGVAKLQKALPNCKITR